MATRLKCIKCPVDGPCVVELDPRQAHLCAKAERGTPSDLAQIQAMSARHSGKPADPPSPKRPAAPTPLVSLALSKTVLRLGGRKCFYGDKPTCGCPEIAFCHLLRRNVNIRDCTACISSMS